MNGEIPKSIIFLGGFLEAQISKSRIKKKSVVREYAEAAVIAVILALLIRTFVVQAFKIPSGSMEPTLLVGDHILWRQNSLHT